MDSSSSSAVSVTGFKRPREEPANSDGESASATIGEALSHSLPWRSQALEFASSLSPSLLPSFSSLLDSIVAHHSAITAPVEASASAAAPLDGDSSTPDPSTLLFTLRDISLLVPRGKYDLLFTPDTIYLDSPNAKVRTPAIPIPYSHIQTILNVPDSNKRDYLLVLRLCPGTPLKVGKSMYEGIIMKFDPKTTAKQENQAIFPVVNTDSNGQYGSIWADYVSKNTVLYTAIAGLLGHLPIPVSLPYLRGIGTPDRLVFLSNRQESFLNCYCGTVDGSLYPLPTGLLFVKKPVLFLPIDLIESLKSSRGDGRTCDIHVECEMKPTNNRTDKGKVESFTFSMIDSSEQPKLEEYLRYIAKKQKQLEKEKEKGKGKENESGMEVVGNPTEGSNADAAEDGVEDAADEELEILDRNARKTKLQAKKLIAGNARAERARRGEDEEEEENTDGEEDRENGSGSDAASADSDESSVASSEDSDFAPSSSDDEDDAEYDSEEDRKSFHSSEEERDWERGSGESEEEEEKQEESVDKEANADADPDATRDEDDDSEKTDASGSGNNSPANGKPAKQNTSASQKSAAPSQKAGITASSSSSSSAPAVSIPRIVSSDDESDDDEEEMDDDSESSNDEDRFRAEL